MHAPPHMPTAHLARRTRVATASAGALALLLLSACGEGQGVLPSAPVEASPEQKVAQLEASGAIPQLDRLPTLAGIDANRDGVRDDIALHIEKTYTDPAQRKAALQMARAYQRMLLVDKKDAVALEETSEQMMRAIACEGMVFRGPDGLRKGTEMAHNVRAMTTNTKDRLQAYLAYNKARSGSVSVRVEGDNCE